MDNVKCKMENERSEPGHLESGGVDNVKWKIEKLKKTIITLKTNTQITNYQYTNNKLQYSTYYSRKRYGNFS